MTVQLFSMTSTGLRVRLLAIILILIGPLAIYQMVGFYQLRTTRARITQERAFELAKAGAARFQDTIDDTRTVLNLLSRVPEVTNGSPEKCSHFLRDTAATHRWARSLSLIGEDQKVACSTNPSAIGFDVSERSWFLDGHKNGGFNVSGFLVTQVSGMPSTFASLFFRNGLTQRPQTLLASLDLAWFDRISATFGEKQQALVLLIDGDGVILSRYPMSPIPGNANVSRQFLAEISNPERPMFVGVDPDGGERLFGSVSLPEAHAHVVIGFDRAATLGTIDKFIVIAALVFGGVLLLGGFIVWVIGEKIFVRPIEEMNGMLRTTLDSMDQGLIAIDPHGKSSMINLRVLDLLDLPREFATTHPHKDEILEFQRSIGEFVNDEHYATAVKDFGQGQGRPAIYERKRPNGTVLEIRTVPTGDGGFVRTYSDVTARRAAEAALRLERDRAENAARATSEFLANMSHELRTPLTAIIGVSDMLLSRSQSPDRQQHFMEMQRNAGQGLLGIINNILDFPKIEAGQLDLEAAPFSLLEVADGCVRLFLEQAEHKGLQLSAVIGEDVQNWVRGDEVRLRQILINLVANGVKFTPSGTVTLTIDSVAGVKDAVRFAVTDTGIGISANSLSTIFQRFAQADSSTTRRFGGTGLGLAISRRLIALMGGDIEVRSQPGRGATFSFTVVLPFCRRPHVEPKPALPASHASYRILLAEDNALNRQIIKAMLEQSGHEVVAVNDGAEAVRIAVRNSFDAILMDVQMPDMDGYAATRAIRKAMQDNPSLPIVALTANALSDEAERCLAAGMTVHLPKPVNWPNLFATLDRLVLESRGAASGRPQLTGSGEAAGLRNHNIFDTATLTLFRNTVGDQNAASLLKLFVVEARDRFVLQPTSAEARESISGEAHSFGGSAGMLGFEDLAQACLALQSVGLEGSQFDECLDRCRRGRDAALRKIAELMVDDSFVSPAQSTA